MTLLEKIALKENLFSAWAQIKKNPHSHGIDQETISAFQEGLYSKIRLINRRLRNNKFSFSPYRGHPLRIKGKKPRPLLIPTVTDRIVQKAIVNIIGKYFYSDFRDCCYGYVKGKKISDAVSQIMKCKNDGNFFILEADIISFFDTVNRNKLLAMIVSKFKRDSSINMLMKNAIDAQVGNPEVFRYQDIPFLQNADIGIPQGGILSPLFANIYLSGFDKQMTLAKYNLIRYADDFIVLGKSEKDLTKAYFLGKEIFERELNLKMHPLSQDNESKTKISNFKLGFKFLGIQFTISGFHPSAESVRKVRAKIDELTNFNRVITLTDSIMKLHLLLHGWGNAYRYCNNKQTYEIFKAADKYITIRLEAMLKKLRFLPKKYSLSSKQRELLKIPRLCDILVH